MTAAKRVIISGAILLVLAGWARPAQAGIPFIDVRAFGLELCEQRVCGAAFFFGFVNGQVGPFTNALGTFAVAINHTDLPLTPAQNPAFVTGGLFEFRFGLLRIRGGIVPGGLLLNNGNNTFSVQMELVTFDNERLDAEVLLDHRVFPPIVTATVVSQQMQ
jgi:hypothetical protein